MKDKILYMECASGISGDMTVAALLDLGADRQVLMNALDSLPLSGYSVEIRDVFKSGIRACDFNVILERDNHDHDMEYLHGKQNGEDEHAEHVHAAHEHTENVHAAHEHSEHEHPNHGHAGHHHYRNLHDITEIILSSRMTEHARTLALKIFRILAEAEASVHGKTVDEVHFHEVGAVDSIVDIVAAAVCIDNLQPTEIIFSALTDGIGQIRCQHGLIPVPVPAVAAIAVKHSLTLKTVPIEGELVTPTGAAIAAAVATGTELPAEYRVRNIGLGAGKRDYKTAGLLRAMILEPSEKDIHDTIVTLETNIDDCTGEALSFTLQELMDQGALDVFYTPIFMKKSRPAYLLKVICRPEDREKMEAVIFRNTTTIGIRYQEMKRTKLDRRSTAVETPWGMADIKCCTYGNDTFYYPENDSVCRLAKSNEIGFPEMYGLIQSYVRDMESRNGND